MKDKELEEQFKERAKEVLKRAHERPYGDPDVGRWDEYNDLAALVEAKNNLIAQERRKAKIEVLEKPILLELHIKQSQDYKQGFRDAVEQVESYRKDKLAELKEDKDYSCEICGADPMTPNCNNANCDR